MKERRIMGSSGALALRLGGTALVLWLLLMTVLTWITAHMLDQSLSEQNWEKTEYLISHSRLADWAGTHQNESQDIKDYWIWEGVRAFGNQENSIGGGPLRSVQQPVQTAAVIYDGEGNLLEQNKNALYMQYMTEETWRTAESDMVSDGSARALCGESDIERLAVKTLQQKDWIALRLTGFLEDGVLQTSKIEYIPDQEFHAILFDRILPEGVNGSYSFERHQLIQEMESEYGLAWETFSVSSFTHADQQVYYTVNAQASWYEPGDPIRQGEETYENMMAWLLELGKLEGSDAVRDYDRGDLWDRLICREAKIYADPETETKLAYRVLSAVRWSPMELAMAGLLYVYLGTGLLFALAALLLWYGISRRLVRPLRDFCDTAPRWGALRYMPRWREMHLLEQWYDQARRERERDADEQIRLQKALDYAREAENNRRQMTSAIAHELKTPLAVIHSYAEGLKDRIAEEKRDRYLEVILSETEHMDAMVMEMLDLSRLEAGKVKLIRDTFSLTALTASILEKLELTAQGKKLHIEFVPAGDCMVTADEGRIGQVVSNFLSNAVRYTPVGGQVWVRVAADRFFTWFWVENEGTQLSEQALASVWETFYRADSSRSGEGTGLGLTIAKSIVELHGGECRVRNTARGVEFSFRIKR